MATRPNGTPDKNFFTPKEAAAYIGVNLMTLYKWIQKTPKKDGPPVRDFGTKKHPCYRLPKDKFIEWATRGTES